MPLIRNGRPIPADVWTALDDAEAIGAHSHILVSLERWRAEGRELVKTGRRLGVCLDSGHQAADLADEVRHLDLITVEFPAIGDGRGYSIGRLLRQRHHYSGEMRAVGPIVRDQFPLLQRCGFDAVSARDEAEAAAWDTAIGAISIAYQPDARGQATPNLFDTRQSLVAAA